MKRICVYCGSSSGTRTSYTQAAQELGQGIAQRNLELVYGGASIGLMGIVASAALKQGARVVGIVPSVLSDREIIHAGLSELIEVDSMHTRKARMAELADAFVALPGGLGTFDEVCEILCWGIIGIHKKPCFLIDTDGFWAPFRTLLDHAVTEGFLSAEARSLARFVATPTEMFSELALVAE